MSTVDDRPVTNGHPVDTGIPRQNLPADSPEPPTDPELAGRAGEHPAVRHLRTRLADRTAERDLSREFVQIDSDTVFDEVRSQPEQKADRAVAETIRTKHRKERLRAGKAAVRAERRSRIQATWMSVRNAPATASSTRPAR